MGQLSASVDTRLCSVKSSSRARLMGMMHLSPTSCCSRYLCLCNSSMIRPEIQAPTISNKDQHISGVFCTNAFQWRGGLTGVHVIFAHNDVVNDLAAESILDAAHVDHVRGPPLAALGIWDLLHTEPNTSFNTKLIHYFNRPSRLPCNNEQFFTDDD